MHWMLRRHSLLPFAVSPQTKLARPHANFSSSLSSLAAESVARRLSPIGVRISVPLHSCRPGFACRIGRGTGDPGGALARAPLAFHMHWAPLGQTLADTKPLARANKFIVCHGHKSKWSTQMSPASTHQMGLGVSSVSSRVPIPPGRVQASPPKRPSLPAPMRLGAGPQVSSSH